MRDHLVDEDFIAVLNEKSAQMTCPVCGATGTISVAEKWVGHSYPFPITRGPRGFPLWSSCSQCNSGGIVARAQERRPPV